MGFWKELFHDVMMNAGQNAVYRRGYEDAKNRNGRNTRYSKHGDKPDELKDLYNEGYKDGLEDR